MSTLERNFGLLSLGRYDVGPNIFQLVAKSAGHLSQEKLDLATVHLNRSYPGYLNSRSKLPLPTPNVDLVGAGGQGILGTVADSWVNRTGCGNISTPYNGAGLVYGSISQAVYSTIETVSKPSANASLYAASAQSTSQSSKVQG